MGPKQFRLGVPQRGAILYALVGLQVCLAYVAASEARAAGWDALVAPVFGFVLLLLVLGNRWLAATRIRIDGYVVKVWPFGYIWRAKLIRGTDIRNLTVQGKSKIVLEVQLLDGSVTVLGPFVGWVRRNREMVESVRAHLDAAMRQVGESTGNP